MDSLEGPAGRRSSQSSWHHEPGEPRKPAWKQRVVDLSGSVRLPKGGFVLQPPVKGRLKRILANGGEISEFTATEATVREFPAHVEMEGGIEATRKRHRGNS